MMENVPIPGQAAWDAAYRKSGRRYGGAPPDLPSFQPGSRVLEVGCGDGKSLRAMAGRGWDIIAIDFSRDALRISTRHHHLQDVRFIQANALALPFTDKSFDAVVISHLLGHIPESERSLVASETERILIPGGVVFIRVFSTRDFREGKGVPIGSHTYQRGDGIITHYFSREEVESLFPALVLTGVRSEEWTMVVRREHLTRSEITAEFRK